MSLHFRPTLLGLLLLAAPITGAGERFDAIPPSIVKIDVVSSAPDLFAPWQRSSPEKSGGSGVVIAGGRILTNAHVVADQVHIEVQRGGVGKRFTAEVQHVCDPCDLAILSVANEAFFEDVEPMRIGELPDPQQPVQVYGFPKGGERLSVTEGVVSRIHVDVYSHGASRLLQVQVDAAINAGNSGGPVVSEGKVVGISMQTLKDAENIGDIVPAPIIRHFLDDTSDGSFDGFPELGVLAQTLENQALRQRLGLPDDSRGVLVTAVSRRGSAHGIIEPGDVLLGIAGVPVYEDGTVALERRLRVDAVAVEHRSQVGDEVPVSLFRQGRRISRMVEMRAPRPVVGLVSSDRTPDYRIYGGLVFQVLTVPYLRLFDEFPGHLVRFWDDPSFADYEVLGRKSPANGRREVVVLSTLLSNELTRGYEEFEDQVVYAIDDRPVRDLAHLSRLLDDATGKFVTITLEQGGLLVLDRTRAQRLTRQVLDRYQVVADRSERLMVPASHE